MPPARSIECPRHGLTILHVPDKRLGTFVDERLQPLGPATDDPHLLAGGQQPSRDHRTRVSRGPEN
jgi:hypothetical protein